MCLIFEIDTAVLKLLLFRNPSLIPKSASIVYWLIYHSKHPISLFVKRETARFITCSIFSFDWPFSSLLSKLLYTNYHRLTFSSKDSSLKLQQNLTMISRKKNCLPSILAKPLLNSTERWSCAVKEITWKKQNWQSNRDSTSLCLTY